MKKILTLFFFILVGLSSYAQDCLYINPVTVKQGTEKYDVEILLKNSSASPGAQFYVTLPAGAKLAFEQEGEDQYFDDSMAASEERITSSRYKFDVTGAYDSDKNRYKFVFSQSKVKSWTGNDGVIAVMTMTNAGSVDENSVVIFEDVRYSDESATTHKLGDFTYVLSTGKAYDATGINNVAVSESKSVIFNSNGQMLSTTQKGLNIVKTATGVKKVMVK